MVRIDCFKLAPGSIIADKYTVLSLVGRGWEGEVYLVREKGTGVDHAAKLFYPHRDKNGRSTRFTARKLHKLRKCPIITQYHHQETVEYDGATVRMLVSEYVEGKMLMQYLKELPGKRLTPFEGLHLLRALTKGLIPIHAAREYHGDIHDGNIIVQRRGASFDIKIVDVQNHGPATAELIADDIVDMIRMFYDAVGGQKRYAHQPLWVKEICCGLKRTLIHKKYKTASQLLHHLDTFSWE